MAAGGGLRVIIDEDETNMISQYRRITVRGLGLMNDRVLVMKKGDSWYIYHQIQKNIMKARKVRKAANRPKLIRSSPPETREVRG